MKTISIYSLKGGVGKTTLTYQILNSLKLRNFNVAGIDMDRRHALTDLLDGSNIDCFVIDGELKQDDLTNLDYDFIIVDGTPETSNLIVKSVALSDYVLIPTIADQINLNLLMSDISSVFFQNLHKLKPNLKSSIIINKINQYQTNDVNELRKIIKTSLIEFIPLLNEEEPILAEIGYRTAITMTGSNKSVFNTSNYKAKNEIDYLVDKIIEVI